MTPDLARIGRVVAAVSLIALSARVSAPLPGTSVPQSGQTLAVLLVGGFLGARDGVLSLIGYLAAGSLGAPIFADGASGWAHLFGPTAGYLVGFVLAAGLMGWFADRTTMLRFAPAIAMALLSHSVILGLGWLRLVGSLGPSAAYVQGVSPFLFGSLLKSLIAAGIITVAGKRNLS